MECTFADFFQEFVGLNKLENEVSGDVQTEIRETILGTPVQTFKLKALVYLHCHQINEKCFCKYDNHKTIETLCCKSKNLKTKQYTFSKL